MGELSFLSPAGLENLFAGRSNKFIRRMANKFINKLINKLIHLGTFLGGLRAPILSFASIPRRPPIFFAARFARPHRGE